MTERQKQHFRLKLGLAMMVCGSNPEYAISGSLALMIAGHIEPRTPGDIDLVTRSTQEKIDDAREKNTLIFGDSGEGDIFEHSITAGMVTEVKMNAHGYVIDMPLKHDLFLMSMDYDTILVNGIRIHDPQHIWKAKDHIGGLKHRADRLQFEDLNGQYLTFPSDLLPS